MTHSFEHVAPDEATVTAYLSDRLDPMRAHDFELYCLRHPDFARRVELDLFLKVGLRQSHGRRESQHTRHRLRIPLAIAAGLAFLVVGGLLLHPSAHRGGLLTYRSLAEVPSGLVQGPRASVTLIRVRDGSPIRRVVAPQQAKILFLRVAPDAPPGSRGYALGLAIEPADAASAVTLDSLHPDAEGYIEMYLPLDSLVGQTLRIAVDPSPATATDSLSFRLQVAYDAASSSAAR